MSVTKSSKLNVENIEFNKPKQYSNGKGCAINLKHDNKVLNIQTPRLVSLFGLNTYKDSNDKITSINITLQFNSSSDKPNRIDNLLKKIKRLDNLVKYTANENHKTWLNYHRKIPNEALQALFKESLYYKKLPDGNIDHSMPPTFKIKIPYYNSKLDFTLLDENNNSIDYNLEYLEKLVVDRCIIKCIFNPSIYVVDKNFGITYKVVALQVFENTLPKVDYKSKKNKSESSNPNKIENYFGTNKKNDSDDDSCDEDDELF
jgi:hypothetical protein